MIGYSYAISLAVALSYYTERGHKFLLTLVTWLHGLVWVMLFILLGIQFGERGFIPVFTVFDIFVYYAFVLVTFALFLKLVMRTDILSLWTSLFGFMFVLASFFVRQHVPLMLHDGLFSTILIVHIMLAVAANAFFLLSMVLTGAYLLLNRMLKQKRWNRFVQKAPSLSQIERMVYVLNLVGVSTLFLSIVFGFIDTSSLPVTKVVYDLKFWTSFLILLLYVYYIYRRLVSNWSGKMLAVLNTTAFTIVLLNVLLSNMCLSFHCW